ncbi:unnamed protein product [Peniophora sp. CBMAI 1063]|nr:unnamed protein product [Peniophora sp. CBMAI 1063]
MAAPQLSLAGVNIDPNTVTFAREQDGGNKISFGIRIVYNEWRAAALSLHTRQWAVLNHDQAERIREDLRAIGLGSIIPKKEFMRSSAVLPGTVELVHPYRASFMVGKTKTILDNLSAGTLLIHQMRYIFMYILPASVQHLHRHPPCQAIYAYAGNPGLAFAEHSLDTFIRRALAVRDGISVPSPSPTTPRPFGLPPKPASVVPAPIASTSTPSTNQTSSVASSSASARRGSISNTAGDSLSLSVPMKRPHSAFAGFEDESSRAKARRLDGQQGLMPFKSAGASAVQPARMTAVPPTSRSMSSSSASRMFVTNTEKNVPPTSDSSALSSSPGISGPSAFASMSATPRSTSSQVANPTAKTAFPPSMFVPKPSSRELPSSHAPSASSAASGVPRTHQAASHLAASSIPSSSSSEAQRVKRLQDERDAMVKYAREQSQRLEAAQSQLAAQQAQIAELEMLRKEVARLRELPGDSVQTISTLARAQKTLSEEITLRDERLNALSQEVAQVPELRATIRELEVRAADADTLRQSVANPESLRDVENELTASRALVEQLKRDADALVQQRDAIECDLSQVREANDRLKEQVAEVEILRSRVQELAPFKDKAKLLVQLAQKLKADHDELRSRFLAQETELGALRRANLGKTRPPSEPASPYVHTSEETREMNTQLECKAHDTAVLTRLVKLVEIELEGDSSAYSIEDVFDAVERKVVEFQKVKHTADAMRDRAQCAERKLVDLEARMNALEAIDYSAAPKLTEALIHIAVMASEEEGRISLS